MSNTVVDNRRKHRRVSVAIKTVYHDDIDPDESDCLMSNLSLGGCFLKTDRPATAGSILALRFRLPDYKEPILVKAEVRWVQDAIPPHQKPGMGLKFIQIKEKDLVILKRFIERRLIESLFE